MIIPSVSAGMEKRDFISRVWIPASNLESLSPVAVEAGEGKIVFFIRSSVSYGDNMVYRKGYVLPLLGCMTVFTKIIGSPTNFGLDLLRYFFTGGQDSIFAWLVCL